MVRKLLVFLDNLAKPVALAATGGLFLIFTFILMPVVYGQFVQGSKVCKALDTFFSYTADDAISALACFGPLLRRYLLVELSLDVVYPVVYGLFFALLLTALVRRYTRQPGMLQFLPLLPIFAWFFDLLENLGIAAMILFYPNIAEILIVSASLATSLKWIFVGVCIFCIGILGLHQIAVCMRKRFL